MKHLTRNLLSTFIGLALAATPFGAAAQAVTIYLDDTMPLEKRIDDVLSRMTTAEKIRIIHAQSKFSSAGVPRLGIPDF